MTAYTYSDVAKDLQADGVKNPKYLMVTGEAQATQGFGANGRIGRSVLYIAEVNSGWVACYAAPWIPAALPQITCNRSRCCRWTASNSGRNRSFGPSNIVVRSAMIPIRLKLPRLRIRPTNS